MGSAEQQAISIDVDHNPYLADGARTVDAIVSITAHAGAAAPSAAALDRVEAIVIDCSTSMLSPATKFEAAKRATIAAVAELVDGTHFTVVAGSHQAYPVFPADGLTMPASAASKAAAVAAVEGLTPNGGTAMGVWLAYVCGVVARHPGALAHAILLTDGKNEHETREELQAKIAATAGTFTCDCRGVGTAWKVEELRAISSALLGSVDIVADPEDLAEDFAKMMRISMSKTIPDLTLRVWTPVGAGVRFVKQVAPTIVDLTDRRAESSAQVGEYPLGAWGAEDRDYHIRVELEPAAVGREKLAARLSVVAAEQVLGEGQVNAIWTADTEMSSKISDRVAHYTGQVEMAQLIQEGLNARNNNDVVTAAAKLRRALDLALESGNSEAVERIKKVIDVDERTGTARLRRNVAAADEMALDARSTRTARVRKEP